LKPTNHGYPFVSDPTSLPSQCLFVDPRLSARDSKNSHVSGGEKESPLLNGRFFNTWTIEVGWIAKQI
jgi:hypothetical protein